MTDTVPDRLVTGNADAVESADGGGTGPAAPSPPTSTGHCLPTCRRARSGTCRTGARSSIATTAIPTRDAPTLVLLHGWTASADLQFFTAYEALGQAYSFVAVDHRGHGRGIRNTRDPFRLEDAADDAAALIRALGLGPGHPGRLLDGRPHRTAPVAAPSRPRRRAWCSRRRPWSGGTPGGSGWCGAAWPCWGSFLRAWWYPRSVRHGLRKPGQVAALAGTVGGLDGGRGAPQRGPRDGAGRPGARRPTTPGPSSARSTFRPVCCSRRRTAW